MIGRIHEGTRRFTKFFVGGIIPLKQKTSDTEFRGCLWRSGSQYQASQLKDSLSQGEMKKDHT